GITDFLFAFGTTPPPRPPRPTQAEPSLDTGLRASLGQSATESTGGSGSVIRVGPFVRVPSDAVAADAATTAPATPNFTKQTAQSGGEVRSPEEPPLDEFWEDMPDIFGLIGSPLGGIQR